MNRRIIILITASFLVIVLSLFLLINRTLLQRPPQSVAVITRTKDGFSPDTVTIRQGQTIEFKTKTNQFFWPASDLHPTHELYPEFDPKSPVKPSESWSFTFKKKGVWKFHDHLAPYFTGTIIVE